MAILPLSPIFNAEVSDQSWEACDKFMSSIPNTTLALKTIEEWLRSEGDKAGGELLKKFAAEYLEYEAKTI